MAIEKLEIYRDYGVGVKYDFSRNVDINNFGYNHLSDGNPNTVLSGVLSESLYQFNYQKPDVYPSSIIVGYNGSYNGAFRLQNVEGVQTGFNDISISGYDNTRRFSFTNNNLKTIFSKERVINRGTVVLNNTDKISKLDVFFDGEKNTNNRELTTNNLSILKPIKVNNSSISVGGDDFFYPSSGTELTSVVNQPSSGIDTDNTFIKTDKSLYISSNIPAILTPESYINIYFEEDYSPPLSSIDKLVLRVRAKNPNYTQENNENCVFAASISPRIFNQNSFTLNDEGGNFIAKQTATQVVGSGTFSNYDIDFDFTDPYLTDNDGFNYFKKYNSIALLNDSEFRLYGFTSGVEISSIELLSYTKEDKHIPFSLPSNVYFKDNLKSNFDGFTEGGKKVYNSLYVESIYNELFNGGFFDFREGTGDKAYSLNESNYLKYYNGEISDYDNFEWSSFYNEINPVNYVYRDSVKVNSHLDSYIEFENQPILTEDFTIYLNISTDILSNPISFGSGLDGNQQDALIFHHGNPIKKEFELWHNNSLQRFYLRFDRNDGGSNSIFVDSYDRDNIDLIITCTKSGSFSFISMFEENNQNVASMSVTNRYTSTASKSYIFGSPSTNNSIFRGSQGYINNFGISTSSFSSNNYNNFINSIRKQGALLNGDNFIKLKYPNIEKNLDINIGFNDSQLFVNNEGLYQQDLFDYAYNKLKNNPSGLVIDYEFDNFTNKEVFIEGWYLLATNSSNAIHHYSGIVPSGLNQKLKITPHTSYFENVNKDNFSFGGLQTSIKTFGSGTYDLDLKWKKVDLSFDGWVIPFTGIENINLYTSGETKEKKNIDLYLSSNYQLKNNDLYIQGKDLTDSFLDLYTTAGTTRNDIEYYIHGIESQIKDFDMFLNSATKITSGFDMTVIGGLRKNSSFPMYTSGLTPDNINNSIPLSTISASTPSLFKSVDMYVNSELEPQNVFNMFTKSAGVDNEIFNIYLEQSNNRENTIDMFLFNEQVFVNNSLPFYTNVPYSGINLDFPMYLEREKGETNSIPFVMSSKELSSSDFDMFLNSASLVSGDSVNMYVRGSGSDGKTINLFTHGF